MKNIKKVITIFVICIIGIYTQSLAATKGIIKSETVRLREKATTESSIVALMSLDEEVEILGEENGWYKVEYKDKTGYASKEYIEATQENNTAESEEEKNEENKQDETNTTENNEANTNENTSTDIVEGSKEENIIKEAFKGKISSEIKLKILPLINSSDIQTLQKDTEITVKEIINDWCYIELNDGAGWVRTSKLNKSVQTDETPETKQETEEQPKETTQENNKTEEKKEENKQQEANTKKVGYVNVDTVNVRSKADTSSNIVTSINKNTEVEILGEENNWYKVKVKSKTGYIAAKFISDKKVAETTSRGTDTERTPAETEKKEESKTTNQTASNTKNNTTASTVTNSGTGAEIVAYGKQFLGCKYVSGGTSPNSGFDCSGLTYYVYKNFGKTLSRTSGGQASNGKAVSKSELQLGDIVVFNNDANTKVGHVGIYVGGNSFIHAANKKKGVIITSLSDSYYAKRYVGARRII